MTTFSLDHKTCRLRQQRLLALMEEKQLDLVIITQRENIQWLSGQWFNWYFQPAAALNANGHLTLIAPTKPPVTAAADDVLHYEAQWHSTLRNDQRAASSEVLWDHLRTSPAPHRIGTTKESLSEFLAGSRHITRDKASSPTQRRSPVLGGMHGGGPVGT